MSPQDFEEVGRANSETCKFFTFINQFMLVYMVYSVIKMVQERDDRSNDIVDIIVTFSYILMLFGVSMSIKKSVNKQVREERMKSEFDFSLTDDSISSSMIQYNKNEDNN
jgi:hypothetical protein